MKESGTICFEGGQCKINGNLNLFQENSMKKRNIRWVCAAVMTTVAGITGAQEEGIKLGGMQFHPFVAGDFVYDSNVFQTDPAQKDVYMDLAAGARLNRKTDTVEFDSSAWFSGRFYDKYTEKDGNRWGLAGLVRGNTDKTFGILLVDARQVDDYNQAPTFGVIPSGFEGTVDLAFDRTAGDQPRRIVDALVAGGYLLSDIISVSGGYKLYGVNYYESSATLESWKEDTLGVEVAGKMSDKAVVFVNGQLGVQTGDGSPFGEPAELLTARLGIKNSLTDKSTLRLALGATHYTTDQEEYTEPSFEVNGLWRSTEKIAVFVFGRNEIQPVGDGSNVQLSAQGGAGVNYIVNRVVSMVLSGSLVHNQYLDETLLPSGASGKPKNTTFVGTYRLTVKPVKRLELFGQVEATDAKQDAADDYQRLRVSLGTAYVF
jgi:hypothetical protein